MRKRMMAVAAAVALGTATMATAAMARPGSMHMGHMHMGHMGHPGGFGGHGHFAGGYGGGVGVFDFGGPWLGGPYYDGCYQQRWVLTPFGYRWRTVDVCAY